MALPSNQTFSICPPQAMLILPSLPLLLLFLLPGMHFAWIFHLPSPVYLTFKDWDFSPGSQSPQTPYFLSAHNGFQTVVHVGVLRRGGSNSCPSPLPPPEFLMLKDPGQALKSAVLSHNTPKGCWCCGLRSPFKGMGLDPHNLDLVDSVTHLCHGSLVCFITWPATCG